MNQPVGYILLLALLQLIITVPGFAYHFTKNTGEHCVFFDTRSGAERYDCGEVMVVQRQLGRVGVTSTPLKSVIVVSLRARESRELGNC